jgi:hypothetical protein
VLSEFHALCTTAHAKNIARQHLKEAQKALINSDARWWVLVLREMSHELMDGNLFESKMNFKMKERCASGVKLAWCG